MIIKTICPDCGKEIELFIDESSSKSATLFNISNECLSNKFGIELGVHNKKVVKKIE